MSKKFDLIVVGGGPGGYVAAIRAAQLGMKTALVEREHLGGICLNWGCIPTKALLRCAEVAHLAKTGETFGVKIKGLEYDLEKMVNYSRGIAKRLSGGVAHLLKKNKVTVFSANAKLSGKGTLELTTREGKQETLSAEHIILATGAKARALPGIEPDGERIWSYREAMVPQTIPKSLIIVGSGAIGIEFASFYHEIGVQVTIVEVQNRILPVEDTEISTLAHKAFEKRGITILTDTKLTSLKKDKESVTATLQSGDGKPQNLTAERLISAVGISANTENIGLETTKIQLDRGHIVTDKFSRTHEKGIYAIGDVAGAPWLAHKASHEAIICVEKIMEGKIAGVDTVQPLNKARIPGCTYSNPQIASIGMTEEEARKTGHDVRIGRFPFMANGKAIALGDDQGLVKTIFDAKTGELLGAHMIGAEVTELIQGFAIAQGLETTEKELMHTIFPHPTLSEMMHESVLDAYGKAIHF